MKVVLILPFEVVHMVRGGKRRCYWMGDVKSRKGKTGETNNNQKTNKNGSWEMSPQRDPQQRNRLVQHYRVSLASGEGLNVKEKCHS